MLQLAKCSLFGVLCLMSISAQASEPVRAEKATLSNGLKIVVLENHRAPVVTHMLWFYAGAADEKRGVSGIAHYLEHMMFKGAVGQKDGEYSDTIEALGGEYNAFTAQDYTGYYVTASKDHLETVMKLESQRMQGLAPEDGVFEKEREVIVEERRMRVENQPSTELNEAMRASLFRNHPYHIPVIGWKHEMLSLTQQDVLDFYHDYYAPNNALLILAGDITPKEAIALAEKNYGEKSGWHTPKTATHTPENRTWTQEPPLSVTQQVSLNSSQVQKSQWSRMFLAPSLVHGDTSQAMPLIVLTHLLGGNSSSLLHQDLVVKQKKLLSISTSYDAFSRGPGVFSFRLIPAEGVSLVEAETLLNASLTKIFSASIKAEDIARAKTLLKAESIYARDGISGMAFIFGQLLMIGLDEAFFNGWESAIDTVTAEQMADAAKTFILNQPHVTGHLLPEVTTGDDDAQ